MPRFDLTSLTSSRRFQIGHVQIATPKILIDFNDATDHLPLKMMAVIISSCPLIQHHGSDDWHQRTKEAVHGDVCTKDLVHHRDVQRGDKAVAIGLKRAGYRVKGTSRHAA